MDLPLKLKIDSVGLELGTAIDHRLPSWPPSADFAIVVDAHGRTVSRYSDSKWDLTSLGRRQCVVSFGDGPVRGKATALSRINADLMRRCVAWFMFGDRPVQSTATIVNFATSIRAVFAHCSTAGISAADLVRFPRVADALAAKLSPGVRESTLWALHYLYEQREHLGFTVLDREGLRRLESSLPPHESRQTPYIPPRIWRYQVDRLRIFLEDFHEHRDRIEACFQYCIDAYVANFGSIAEACDPARRADRSPFRKGAPDEMYYGSFHDTAERFGVSDLLARWCLPAGGSLGPSDHIPTLSNYLTQASFIGVAYLINFSGMRIEEACSLRSDCLEVEHDEQLGPIHLLRGDTTKTIRDEALWVSSPSVAIAIDALKCVSHLRTRVAKERISTTPEDIENPRLRVRPYEPWNGGINIDASMEQIHTVAAYAAWKTVSPNLFDEAELLITEEDLQTARLITPTLNPEVFRVGVAWNFTWHQLRRTMAVNMASSGIVSDSSLQYQLKHLTRAMSLYYGQGYSYRNLNQRMRSEYIRTVYEMLSVQLTSLTTQRYLSPFGDSHKTIKLRLLGEVDRKSLAAKAKAGHITFRATLLGGCLKQSCPYGGIDNVAHCIGDGETEACPDSLLDREKVPTMESLRLLLIKRLSVAEVDSPNSESLKVQLRSVEHALNVISNN